MSKIRKLDAIKLLEKEFGKLTFADILRGHRLLRGLTQEEIGEKLGVTKQTVSDYESGRHIPTLKKALEIGTKIDLSPEFIARAIFSDMLTQEGKSELIDRVLFKK